jgi:hypothetical protein
MMDKRHLAVGTRVLAWNRGMVWQSVGYIVSQEDATHYVVRIPLDDMGNAEVVQRHIRYISEAPPEHAPIRGPLTDDDAVMRG